MLSESSATMTKAETPYSTDENTKSSKAEGVSKASKKMEAERKEREHILAMNQILAKQVMEKSRMVAGKKGRNLFRL